MRQLPHNATAEASVLGAVFVDPAVLAALDTLEPGAFYDHRNRAVFQAMRNLEARGRPLDVTTVEAELERAGKLEAVGGIAYLGELTAQVPIADNAVEYARIVEDKARVRALMLAAGDLVERGYEPDVAAGEYLDAAYAALARVDQGRPEGSVSAAELVRRRVAELEHLAAARHRGESGLVGLPTGIQALDELIGGYPLGDLAIIAARPGMGKTACAMAAVDATTAAGYDAHVFASEGGWRMYADRLLARGSGLPVSRIRTGELDGAEDAAAIAQAMARFRHRDNWTLDPRAGLTANEIVRAARARKAKRKPERLLVVVDYVQILRRPRGVSEHEALDELVTTLAQAAVDDDVSYLVLSQLNREVEKRTDKRPQLSDLRGSGALEERARIILFPYRGAYYYDDPREGIDYDCSCVSGAPCSHRPDAETFASTVQVIVAKNNNGAPGRIFARWNGATTEVY